MSDVHVQQYFMFITNDIYLACLILLFCIQIKIMTILTEN